MNPFTVRRTIAVAALAVASASVTPPASAEAPDADTVAQQICGDGVDLVSGTSVQAESGDEAFVELFTYDVGAGPLATLCSFAIIETDEDSQLTGSYALSIADQEPLAGPVAGSVTVTRPLSSRGLQGPVTVTAGGTHLTTDVTTVDVTVPKTAAQKKAAKTKYTKAVKKAKKAYAKAGRTAKAKKRMNTASAKAKKAYRKAIRSAVVERDVEVTVPTPYAVRATSTPGDH
jgi:hypothetical protein